MYLDLNTGQIESSCNCEDLIFPITNEIMDFCFSKMIDDIMDGTLEDFLDTYDEDFERGFWEYVHLLKSDRI